MSDQEDKRQQLMNRRQETRDGLPTTSLATWEDAVGPNDEPVEESQNSLSKCKALAGAQKKRAAALPKKKSTESAKNDLLKSRPKRSLSAYNLFFKHERQKLLDERSAVAAAAAAGKNGTSKPTAGVGFAELAQTIGAKWKKISAEDKAHFEGLAAKDKVGGEYNLRIL